MDTKDNKIPKGLMNPDIEHEYSDINAGAILKFGIGLVVIAVMLYVISAGVYKLFEIQEDASNPPPYPLYANRERLPPSPRLQANEISDLKRIKEAEAKALGYETKAESTEVEVQQNPDLLNPEGTIPVPKPGMPIEKAMEQVLKQGFPVRTTNNQVWKDQAETMPAGSSSGRTLERRLR